MKMDKMRLRQCLLAVAWFGCCAGACMGRRALAEEAPIDLPYAFCEAGPTVDGTVYLSPVFAQTVRGVEQRFAEYATNVQTYRGPAPQCFSFLTEAEAEDVRKQRIEVWHWREDHRVVALDWTPQVNGQAVPPTPSRAD